MTLKEIENDIFEVTDLTTLYKFQLDLSKQVSQIHRLLSEEREDSRKTILKSNLSWASELLDICKARAIDERNSSGKFNYQFRKSAQKRLSPQMYQLIAEDAAK